MPALQSMTTPEAQGSISPIQTALLFARTFGPDPEDFWDPRLPLQILASVPAAYDTASVHLAIIETIANAARHGMTWEVGVRVRRRGRVLSISFSHTPPLPAAARRALRNAKAGEMPTAEELFTDTGGLGFLLIVKSARRVTLNPLGDRLTLWFVEPNSSSIVAKEVQK